jgi:hypothetical protein
VICKNKVKVLSWSAGRPVAIVHKDFAESSSIHVDDRVYIRHGSKRIVAVVDIATGIIKKNQIAVSTEISKYMGLNQGDSVEVKLASKPESLDLIHKNYPAGY